MLNKFIDLFLGIGLILSCGKEKNKATSNNYKCSKQTNVTNNEINDNNIDRDQYGSNKFTNAVRPKSLLGFENTGNTCFMNSALQLLYAAEDFRKAMISSYLQGERTSSNSENLLGRIFFKKFIYEEYKSGKSEQEIKNDLKKAFGNVDLTTRFGDSVIIFNKEGVKKDITQDLKTLRENFFTKDYQTKDKNHSNTTQEDPMEFINAIFSIVDNMDRSNYNLNNFIKVTLNTLKCFQLTTDNPNEPDGVLFKKIQECDNIVDGVKKSDVYSKFTRYEIDKKTGKQQGIEDSVKDIPASLKSFNKYLIIQRLEYILGSECLQRKACPLGKIETSIDIKEYCTQEVANTILNLKAVIVHLSSSQNSGHYICYAKYDSKWYKFDDSSVSIIEDITKETSILSNGVIFLYEKN